MDGRLLGGRYRLLEARAMGGMASVWRAHDERTGEVVAVKRLHPHLIADEGARERFRREASAMEAIRHPNVVGVRDAVVDADEPALVMDFIAGRSVAELAADGRAFDAAEALRVAAAVADGLATVHAAGIVHRDLKPANVLIGDDGVVRLSDFGIAVGLEDATALTAEDGVVGTLRYLAPERLAGSLQGGGRARALPGSGRSCHVGSSAESLMPGMRSAVRRKCAGGGGSIAASARLGHSTGRPIAATIGPARRSSRGPRDRAEDHGARSTQRTRPATRHSPRS
jgi:serine/threonine protein kinase